MDLHPTGSDKLLEIRTGKVNIVIKSKTFRKAMDEAAVSSVSIIGTAAESVKIGGVTRELDIDGSFVMPSIQNIKVAPMFFEQTDYEIVVEGLDNDTVSLWHENYSIREKVSPINERGNIITGIINFGNNVGFSDFEISVGGKKHLTIRVEVYPSKISYKEDYQQMIADISNEVYSVAIDFLRKTYQNVKISSEYSNIPAVFFQIISIIFEDFKKSANKILVTPHHKLTTEHQVLPYHRIKDTDRSTEKWIERHPEYVKHTTNGIAVSRALAVKKIVTYNTVENQFTKFIIKKTISRLKDFEQRYKISTNNLDKVVLDKVKIMQNALNRLVNASFLNEVDDYKATQSMSLVFEMAPGYRELFKYYLMLQRGLEINGDVFKISVKETAQLYEYWCFIKLVSIMKRNYKLASSDVIKVDYSGITVTLVKGRKSEVHFVNPRTGEQMTLSYNPGEQQTQTVSQKPDNVLTLEKTGSDVPYKYVFDAKYRIESNPDSYYPDTKPGPKLDDINTMHRYRDSIVYANQNRFTFEKTMFGAYILFPYSNEEEYKQHQFYKSIDTVNIGGLPFLPGATSLVENFLSELVADSEESAFERATLPRGIETKLKKVDWNVKDVLVGSIGSQEQLEINLRDRFYYVPAKHISQSDFPVRRVAIYQSAYNATPGIRYYADVLTTRKVKRKNIPVKMRSNNGEEDYYLFTVSAWKELKTPIAINTDIVKKPRFTNNFLLEHCESAYELFNVNSDEEYRLLVFLHNVKPPYYRHPM